VAKLILTAKQQVVFDFIQRYFEEHRMSPLIREVQVGCQIASYKSAIDRLNALEHKRYIRRAPNRHRGIRLLRKMLEGQPKTAEPSLASAGAGVPA